MTKRPTNSLSLQWECIQEQLWCYYTADKYCGFFWFCILFFCFFQSNTWSLKQHKLLKEIWSNLHLFIQTLITGFKAKSWEVRLTISRVCSLRNLISSPGLSKHGRRRPTVQRSSVKYSGVVFLTATWELIYRVMKFTECSTRSPEMGNRVKHERNYKWQFAFSFSRTGLSL